MKAKYNTPSVNNNAYKSLLYWRKNLWNGSACAPVIVTLEADTLSMKSADDTIIFSESLEQVTPRFTGWGTMILTVKDQKYDIVGMPAADSPVVSDLQKAELGGLTTDGGAANDRDVQPVALGAAASTATYYRGLTSIREWKSLIGSPSDQKKSMNYMAHFIGLVIIGLILAIVFK
jgi:hypothetical protein